VRLALDTNVLVSAVVARGVSRRLFDLWREQRFELVACPMFLDELDEVLRRDRFRRVIAPDEVDARLSPLRTGATVVEDPADNPPVTADPDDDYLVALARREQADALVSGDRHLTDLALP
jgi:uncharacterized protein